MKKTKNPHQTQQPSSPAKKLNSGSVQQQKYVESHQKHVLANLDKTAATVKKTVFLLREPISHDDIRKMGKQVEMEASLNPLALVQRQLRALQLIQKEIDLSIIQQQVPLTHKRAIFGKVLETQLLFPKPSNQAFRQLYCSRDIQQAKRYFQKEDCLNSLNAINGAINNQFTPTLDDFMDSKVFSVHPLDDGLDLRKDLLQIILLYSPSFENLDPFFPQEYTDKRIVVPTECMHQWWPQLCEQITAWGYTDSGNICHAYSALAFSRVSTPPPQEHPQWPMSPKGRDFLLASSDRNNFTYSFCCRTPSDSFRSAPVILESRVVQGEVNTQLNLACAVRKLKIGRHHDSIIRADQYHQWYGYLQDCARKKTRENFPHVMELDSEWFKLKTAHSTQFPSNLQSSLYQISPQEFHAAVVKSRALSILDPQFLTFVVLMLQKILNELVNCIDDFEGQVEADKQRKAYEELIYTSVDPVSFDWMHQPYMQESRRFLEQAQFFKSILDFPQAGYELKEQGWDCLSFLFELPHAYTQRDGTVVQSQFQFANYIPVINAQLRPSVPEEHHQANNTTFMTSARQLYGYIVKAFEYGKYHQYSKMMGTMKMDGNFDLRYRLLQSKQAIIDRQHNLAVAHQRSQGKISQTVWDRLEKVFNENRTDWCRDGKFEDGFHLRQIYASHYNLHLSPQEVKKRAADARKKESEQLDAELLFAEGSSTNTLMREMLESLNQSFDKVRHYPGIFDFKPHGRIQEVWKLLSPISLCKESSYQVVHNALIGQLMELPDFAKLQELDARISNCRDKEEKAKLRKLYHKHSTAWRQAQDKIIYSSDLMPPRYRYKEGSSGLKSKSRLADQEIQSPPQAAPVSKENQAQISNSDKADSKKKQPVVSHDKTLHISVLNLSQLSEIPGRREGDRLDNGGAIQQPTQASINRPTKGMARIQPPTSSLILRAPSVEQLQDVNAAEDIPTVFNVDNSPPTEQTNQVNSSIVQNDNPPPLEDQQLRQVDQAETRSIWEQVKAKVATGSGSQIGMLRACIKFESKFADDRYGGGKNNQLWEIMRLSNHGLFFSEQKHKQELLLPNYEIGSWSQANFNKITSLSPNEQLKFALKVYEDPVPPDCQDFVWTMEHRLRETDATDLEKRRQSLAVYKSKLGLVLQNMNQYHPTIPLAVLPNEMKEAIDAGWLDSTFKDFPRLTPEYVEKCLSPNFDLNHRTLVQIATEGLHVDASHSIRQYEFTVLPPKLENGIAIQKLLLKGIAKVWTDPNQVPIINSSFMVPKPGKAAHEGRIVLDCCALNIDGAASIAATTSVFEPLKKRFIDWFCTLDLEMAFYSVAIAEDSQKYFGFIYDDVIYVLTRLPMGYNKAPYILEQVVKPILSRAEREIKRNVSVTSYIDDVMIAGKTEEDANDAYHQVRDLFVDAGFSVNFTKGQAKPVREVKWMGCMIDKWGVRNHPDKIEEIDFLYRKYLKERQYGIWRKLKGKGEFLAMVNQQARAFMARLQRYDKVEWLTKPDYEVAKKKFNLPREAFKDFGDFRKVIVKNEPTYVCTSQCPHCPKSNDAERFPLKNLLMAIDASGHLMGMASYHGDPSLPKEKRTPDMFHYKQKNFRKDQQSWPIHMKELMALFVALKTAPKHSRIRFLCDNSVVCEAIANWRSPKQNVNDLIIDIKKLCISKHIDIEIQYCHTSDNPADYPTRTKAEFIQRASWKQMMKAAAQCHIKTSRAQIALALEVRQPAARLPLAHQSLLNGLKQEPIARRQFLLKHYHMMLEGLDLSSPKTREALLNAIDDVLQYHKYDDNIYLRELQQKVRNWSQPDNYTIPKYICDTFESMVLSGVPKIHKQMAWKQVRELNDAYQKYLCGSSADAHVEKGKHQTKRLMEISDRQKKLIPIIHNNSYNPVTIANKIDKFQNFDKQTLRFDRSKLEPLPEFQPKEKVYCIKNAAGKLIYVKEVPGQCALVQSVPFTETQKPKVIKTRSAPAGDEDEQERRNRELQHPSQRGKRKEGGGDGNQGGQPSSSQSPKQGSQENQADSFAQQSQDNLSSRQQNVDK